MCRREIIWMGCSRSKISDHLQINGWKIVFKISIENDIDGTKNKFDINIIFKEKKKIKHLNGG